MLPAIQRQAKITFACFDNDTREEAIQETVCNACLAYAKLAKQGRVEVATKTSLARYAVAQVKAGRRVGCTMNCDDITSWYCQKRTGVTIQSMATSVEQSCGWQEMLVEDRSVSPADLAASRIDYASFLQTLSDRIRQIAETLSTGETTKRVAKLFGLSAGRVSQIRRELKTAWESFHEPKNIVTASDI